MTYVQFKSTIERLLGRPILWAETNLISWAWEMDKTPEWTAQELTK